MNLELVGALNELERERGISKEILLEAIEAAIISAYKRGDDAAQNVRVDVSEKTGQIRVFAQKEVVEEVMDGSNEISLGEARSIDPNYQPGDTVEVEVTPKDFGRIAAQTAKQVVIQRIREAERALVFEEYSNRQGDVVTGIVQRSDSRNVLVDLGKVEAILPPSEQMPKENYTHGMRIKAYVSEVRQTTKGPQVIVSRSHPGLMKRLFELEVPEIHDGVVEIRAVAREAGNRSKIAVSSRDSNVDPVGACVGPRGMRVQTVVQELKGEKIDIVEYDHDPERFVANALSPARVMRVFINEEDKTARAVVPDHQLSLAIGREGQNARLAARLSGWKIDIKSESQMAELALLEAERALEAKAQEAVAETVEEEALEVVGTVDEVGAQEDVPAALDGVEVEDTGIEAPVAQEVQVDEVVAEIDEAEVEDELVEGIEEEAPQDAIVDLEEDAETEIIEEQDEPAAVAAESDVVEDLEILDEMLEELESTTEEPEVVVPKVKKSRAAKKAELQDLIEEDVLDEDAPLPSLFDDDDDEIEDELFEDDDSPTVYVVDSDSAETPATAKNSRSEAEEKGSKEKLILKDLSELARLLDAKDEEE